MRVPNILFYLNFRKNSFQEIPMNELKIISSSIIKNQQIRKDNMNLVQTEQNVENSSQLQIVASIKSAISQIPDSLEIQPPNLKDNQYIRLKHVTMIDFKQLSEKVKLLWEFKVLTHVLLIKVSPLDQQTLAYDIKRLCKKNRQQVIYFFNHVNNLNFNQNEGEFCLHKDSKIVYQFREDHWYALQNTLKLKSYLQKKLKKISEIFNHHFQAFLIKFRLLPNLLIEQKQIETVQKLNQLKYFFQENKKNLSYPPQMALNMQRYRKYASQVDLKKVANFDSSIMAFIECKFPSFLSEGLCNKGYEDMKYDFKLKASGYLSFADSKEIMYPLVIAMEVIQVRNETLLNEKGGFGQITRALYSCKYGKTVYDDINRELDQQNYYSQQIFNRYLCKKSSFTKQCEAFQNQKQALIKLRNKKSPHIAQYYCNISKGKPFDDGSIYMDVYASNIDQIPTKLKQKFSILRDVIKGLYFLNFNGILHRDMKPQNIVVDRQMKAKIIDFGSCCNVYQRQDLFKPYDSKLRSTKGYFARYEQYQQNIDKKVSLMTKQQFYQHYFFDIYSYGKIIQKMFNLTEFESPQEDLLISQVYYLSKKCTEVNPSDRLSHEQIQYFLEKVVDIEKNTVP